MRFLTVVLEEKEKLLRLTILLSADLNKMTQFCPSLVVKRHETFRLLYDLETCLKCC